MATFAELAQKPTMALYGRSFDRLSWIIFLASRSQFLLLCA